MRTKHTKHTNHRSSPFCFVCFVCFVGTGLAYAPSPGLLRRAVLAQGAA